MLVGISISDTSRFPLSGRQLNNIEYYWSTSAVQWSYPDNSYSNKKTPVTIVTWKRV